MVGMQIGPGGYLSVQWIALQKGTLSYKNPNLLEQAISMRPFAPEGQTILPKAVHYTNFLKKRVHNKRQRGPLWASYAEA